MKHSANCIGLDVVPKLYLQMSFVWGLWQCLFEHPALPAPCRKRAMLQADVSRHSSAKLEAALELRRTSSVQGLSLTAAHPKRVLSKQPSPPGAPAVVSRSGSSHTLHRPQANRRSLQSHRSEVGRPEYACLEAGKILRASASRHSTGRRSVGAQNLDIQRVRGLSQVITSLLVTSLPTAHLCFAMHTCTSMLTCTRCPYFQILRQTDPASAVNRQLLTLRRTCSTSTAICILPCSSASYPPSPLPPPPPPNSAVTRPEHVNTSIAM